MPSRVTLPSTKFCSVAPTSAQTVPDELSRQAVAIAAMCDLNLNLPAERVIHHLIHAEISTGSRPDSREVKDLFPGFALELVRPFLSQMVIIFLDHRETGVVPVIGRFQAGNSNK